MKTKQISLASHLQSIQKLFFTSAFTATLLLGSAALEASETQYTSKDRLEKENKKEHSSLVKAQNLFNGLKSLSNRAGEIHVGQGCRILDLEEISDLQLYGERKPFAGFRFRLEKGARFGSWFWGRSQDLYLYPDQELLDHRLVQKDGFSLDQRPITRYEYESMDLYEIGRLGTELQKKNRVVLIFDENHHLMRITFKRFERRYGETNWTKSKEITCRSSQ